MTYTLNPSYSVPYDLGLYYSNRGKGRNTRLTVIDEVSQHAYWLGWIANGYTFQANYRMRRRYKPSEAILIDPTGADVWEDWGAWQGVNVDISETASEVGTANTALPVFSWLKISGADVKIQPSYDLTTYDAIEYELRVRQFNATTKEVSEWAVQTIRLDYLPNTTTAAQRNADGSVTISVNTNWERGGNRFSIGAFANETDGNLVRLDVDGVSVDNEAADFTIEAPTAAAPDSAYLYTMIPQLSTSDGISGNPWEVEGLRYGMVGNVAPEGYVYRVPITTIPPVTPIPDPVVSIDNAGNVYVVSGNPSAPADLTGTTWVLNISPVTEGADVSKSVYFTSNGESFSEFIRPYVGTSNSNSVYYYSPSGYVYAYNERKQPPWVDQAYRTVMFTGGADATDSELIDWLMANATLVQADYSRVIARCDYTDEEGNTYSETIELTEADDVWRGKIATPPLDVDVDVVVVCYVGDDWESFTTTAHVDSGGLVMFDWGDDHFAIRYNPDRQITIELSASAVNIAGQELPRSRHGIHRTSNMTMTGTLINPAEDAYNGDGWLAQLEILNKPHDWYFRTPNGLRRRVMVTDYTPAWATQSANRVMQVTINMQEVAD